MTTEQTIDGIEYRTGALNAKEQFHVARRLAPVIAAMGDVSTQGGNLMTAIAEAISKLSDADCDYIIRTTMKVVNRKSADRWVPVWNTQADMPQFSDMNAGQLLQLAYIVLQDNLSGFTSGQGDPGQAPSNIGLNTRLN